jgi:undecaprenyl pyrophosphate phosphatase UppP
MQDCPLKNQGRLMLIYLEKPIINMARKWTLEERKKHLREHYPEKRRKFGIMAGLLLLILLIAAALGWSIRSQIDVGLTLMLAVALVIVVVGAVFLLDNQFYETW